MGADPLSARGADDLVAAATLIERIYVVMKDTGGMMDAPTLRVLCGAPSVRAVEKQIQSLVRAKRIEAMPPRDGRQMWRAV